MRIEDATIVENLDVPKKRSWLGILSIVLASCIGTTYCVAFAIFADSGQNLLNIDLPLVDLSTLLAQNTEIADLIFALCAVASPVLLLAALGVAIGGLLQKDRYKLPAIIGVSLSFVLLIATCSLLLIAISTFFL